MEIGKPYEVHRGMNCWVVMARWGDHIETLREKEDAEETADMLNTAYERGYIDGKNY